LHDKIDDSTIVQKIVCFANGENAASSYCIDDASRMSSLNEVDIEHLAIAVLSSVLHADNFDRSACDQLARDDASVTVITADEIQSMVTARRLTFCRGSGVSSLPRLCSPLCQYTEGSGWEMGVENARRLGSCCRN
jgi:hypothetical protein